MKKVLIVVAHPDDETIWMGGTILKHSGKDWDTTIISLCRKNDSDRAPKFKKVCEIYNAKSKISDLDDEKLNDLTPEEILEKLIPLIEKKYDYIFTHGVNGEYGHKRHKEVHKAIKELLKKQLIDVKKVFFFSYRERNGNCYKDSSSDKFIKLNALELLRKKQVIENVYGFRKKSFEEKNSKEIESFKILNLK